MSENQLDPNFVEEPLAPAATPDSIVAQIRRWMHEQLPWWATSFTIHMAALASLLLLGRFVSTQMSHESTEFSPPETLVRKDEPLQPMDPGRNLQPSVIDLTAAEPAEVYIDNSAVFVAPITRFPSTLPAVDTLPPRGFDVPRVGPGSSKPGNPLGTQDGGNKSGHVGGKGEIGEYDQRGKGHLPGTGVSQMSERSVAAALVWLARHQSRDGSWSLQNYVKQCTDKTCTGVGTQESVSAATAMGVLPFLAAGQWQGKPGPYQRTVFQGIYWLISHQKPDGDLSAGADQQMYSHGLAAIALCEAYGMSLDKNGANGDKTIGAAAQRAINFIQAAQNSKTGGWRYHPGDEGDTSVVGWQLMALKSAQMAGLKVNPAALDGTKRWLAAASTAAPGGSSSAGSGRFAYQPAGAATPTMSAVGLLCSQYLHAGKSDPVIVGGVQYLMTNLPNDQSRNVYYWYYASQVMHNMDDADWRAWNIKMRTLLIESQTRAGCAAGSWDPDLPTRDAWGNVGGRLMMTSLSCLTLEVYYRYLPLYRINKAGM